MKKIFILIVVFLVISAIVMIVFTRKTTRERNQVCFRNNCFDVELALTPEEQRRGLMFRKSLDSDEGMLFIFKEEGAYPFWMEDTPIPLDIIWLNRDKEVTFINENTSPCISDFCPEIKPSEKAKYVLEINGGISQGIGLAVGEKMDFNIDYPLDN